MRNFDTDTLGNDDPENFPAKQKIHIFTVVID